MKQWKQIIAMLLCVAILLSLTACSSMAPEDPELKAVYEHAENAKKEDPKVFCAPLAETEITTDEQGMTYSSSRLDLTANDGVSYKEIEKLAKSIQASIAGCIELTGDYQLLLKEPKTKEELEQLVTELQENELVANVSLTYLFDLANQSVDYRNDPWSKDSSEVEWNEWTDPNGENWWAEAIDMPAVWDNPELNLQPVKVGIVDSMFDLDHNDLNDGLFLEAWENPKNEDGSCKVAELYKNAETRDQLRWTLHGTHVAGLIAARGGNSHGITGVSQNAELYGYSFYHATENHPSYTDTFLFKTGC